MDNFAKQIAWQNYFAHQMAGADIEEIEAESVVKVEEAKVMLTAQAERRLQAAGHRRARRWAPQGASPRLSPPQDAPGGDGELELRWPHLPGVDPSGRP
jgi:hypothetical protein